MEGMSLANDQRKVFAVAGVTANNTVEIRPTINVKVRMATPSVSKVVQSSD
jgi:hypothetical protein